MGVKFFFKWFDLWVGLYIDWPRRVFYFCPLPCVGVRIQLRDTGVARLAGRGTT